MKQNEGIDFLEKPIESRREWFTALAPFLLVVLMGWLSLLIFGIDSRLFASIVAIVIMALIFIVLVFFLKVFLAGLAQGLPNWTYPITGFILGMLGLIFDFCGGYQIHFLSDITEFSSIQIHELAFHSQESLLLIVVNYALSVLMTFLVVLIRRSKKIATSVRQNVLWFSFLFYCSAIVVPFLSIITYTFFDALLLMGLWYIPQGLGAYVFLRFTESGKKYLALMISILLSYGLCSLGIYSIQLNEGSNYTHLPLGWPAIIVAIEGAVILMLIALPAFFEFMLYLRSVVEEEKTIIE